MFADPASSIRTSLWIERWQRGADAVPVVAASRQRSDIRRDVGHLPGAQSVGDRFHQWRQAAVACAGLEDVELAHEITRRAVGERRRRAESLQVGEGQVLPSSIARICNTALGLGCWNAMQTTPR